MNISNTVLLFIILIPFSLQSYSQDKKKSKSEIELEAKYQIWRSEIKDGLSSCRQRIRSDDGIIIYEIIDSLNAQGIKKSDLVTAFKESMADVAVEAKTAIDIEDKEGGLVIAKLTDAFIYTVTNKSAGKWGCKYTVKFQAKDGKYRVQIYDIKIAEQSEMFYLINKNVSKTYVSIDGSSQTEEELFKMYKKMTINQRSNMKNILFGFNTHMCALLFELRRQMIKKIKDDF